MKLISYILFTLSIFSGLSLSRALASADFNEKVKKLVEKEYVFYAFKKSTIYYLNGRKRHQKVAFEEFLRPKMFTPDERAHHAPGIARDMVYYNKKGFEIVLRKKNKFYTFRNGKLVKFIPLNRKQDFGVKKVKKRTVEKTHCKYCTYKLSGNYITLDDVPNSMQRLLGFHI